jgi:hypothetical protein
MGLELISVDAAPATAEYIGKLDLGRYDWTRSILHIRFYVADVTTFNNTVYGSRLEFLSDFTGRNAYILWFDRAQTSGWNDLSIPLIDLAVIGHPNPSRVVGAQVIVYSTARAQARVYLISLTEQTL